MLQREVRELDPDADPVAVARTICLNQLEARPRSRAELETVLRRRLVPEAAAATALDRLTEVGLVDDAAFAEAWVRSRRSTRGLASRVLVQELRQRGVSAEHVEAAVSQLDDGDEATTAAALAERRARAMTGLPPAVAVRRLVGFLARKGYGGTVAHEAALSAVRGLGAVSPPAGDGA